MKHRSHHTGSLATVGEGAPATMVDEKQLKIQLGAKQKRMERMMFLGLCVVIVLGLASQLPRGKWVVAKSQDDSSHEFINSEKPLLAEEFVVDPSMTMDYLQKIVDYKEAEVRVLTNLLGEKMEHDPWAIKLKKELQLATWRLIKKRYGASTFRVRVDVQFPNAVETAEDHFFIEMAPIDLIPCSVYYFIELVRDFKSGAFIQNTDKLLQAHTPTNIKKRSMAFQEYSPLFPHAKYTTGYAGRPSGPQWYVNIKDNTKAHGPGSQQTANKNEADSLFGKIVEGGEKTVIPRIHATRQTGFLDAGNQITITAMTLLVLSPANEWVPWTEPDHHEDKVDVVRKDENAGKEAERVRIAEEVKGEEVADDDNDDEEEGGEEGDGEGDDDGDDQEEV